MFSAQLITIGTEITSGEVINTNAAWLSQQLEDLGIRVLSHLTVRDRREEILKTLAASEAALVIVTGGLGPTSDDITRDCMAVHSKMPLDFDNQVWADLKELYRQRGLPLREAHRWQCHFPRGATKLANPTGTALGFYQLIGGRHFFVMPGPPRELEGMWHQEVKPVAEKLRPPTTYQWIRWTCLGAPESEVAELVEPLIKEAGVEVGYRAQVPYVRVKIYADPAAAQPLVAQIEKVLAPFIVARGNQDLAVELLREWPDSEFHLSDHLTDGILLNRLFTAFRSLPSGPKLLYKNSGGLEGPGLQLQSEEEGFNVILSNSLVQHEEQRGLPYKIPVDSERGRRSAAEWALWIALSAIRARDSQP